MKDKSDIITIWDSTLFIRFQKHIYGKALKQNTRTITGNASYSKCPNFLEEDKHTVTFSPNMIITCILEPLKLNQPGNML